MKKIYLLLFLFFSIIINAQVVNIPDANFKSILLLADVNYQIAKDSSGNYVAIDTNSDGEIQVGEALLIKSLEISNTQITNAAGLEAFTGLTHLSFGGSQVISLPMNSLVNLEYLSLGGNHSLTTLDLSHLTNLQTAYCNYNNLSSINVAGLSNLHTLTFDDNSLTSINLTGLTSLTELRCNSNQLTAIDLSGLTNLEIFLCYQNHISNLDLTGLVNLQSLICSGNLLTTLDVSGCVNLIEFGCDSNQLTTINVDNLIHLRNFGCSGNLLTSLSFNNVPGLMYLGCTNNQLTSLDLSNVPLLSNLYCNNNLLTTLDLNSNINLVNVVFMTNPLVSLFMKNGRFQQYPTGIETGTGPIDTDHTPLQFLCADEDEINYWQSIFHNTLLTSTYCTITPGGNYNTISGRILFDANNNGCDSNDLPFPNTRININDGTTQGANFTNADGSYEFYTMDGSFDLTPSVDNQAWFNFSPSSVSTSFADANNNTTTQNFCITANGVHPDLEIVITPITTARPGFTAQYQVVYRNKGNQQLSGDITFNYDDNLIDFSTASVMPNSQSNGNLQWTYSNLMPFEERSFVVSFNVNSPTATPPVSIGTVLHFSASINPLSGDEKPTDNSFNFNQTVVGSLDPNDKICLEGNSVETSKIGDYLHYAINFENTGNAATEFVVIKDIIDTTKFDINTLQVMHSSHHITTKIIDSEVEFHFADINLDAGQHGNVVFKIKTKNTLTEGDTATNNAGIYFDYNLPVRTNTASTTFQTLGIGENHIDTSVVVFPNPASGNVNINANNIIKSVQIFDMQGRILETRLVEDKNANLNVSAYSKAVYFLKVTTENGSKTKRFIKE